MGIAGHDGTLMDVRIIPATHRVRVNDVTSATVLFTHVMMNHWGNGWRGKIRGESGHAKDVPLVHVPAVADYLTAHPEATLEELTLLRKKGKENE